VRENTGTCNTGYTNWRLDLENRRLHQACHGTGMSESCHYHVFGVTSRTWVSESCYHICQGHEWVVSLYTSHTWVSHVIDMNELCHHTCHRHRWDMSPCTSRTWVSHVIIHVTDMNEWYYTLQTWVTIWVTIHVTDMSESCHNAHVRIHICVYMCVCACVCVYVRKCVCVCVFVCVCVCVCMYIHLYTCAWEIVSH